MNYTYLLHSLIFAGVLVIGIEVAPRRKADPDDAPSDTQRSSGEAPAISPILTKLDLSAEQEEQIKALLTLTADAFKGASHDRAKRREIRENYERVLDGILTPPQRAKLKRLRSGQ